MMDAGCYCAHVSRTLAAAARAQPAGASVSGKGTAGNGTAQQLYVTAAAAKLYPSSDSLDGAMVVNWSTKEPAGNVKTSWPPTKAFSMADATAYSDGAGTASNGPRNNPSGSNSASNNSHNNNSNSSNGVSPGSGSSVGTTPMSRNTAPGNSKTVRGGGGAGKARLGSWLRLPSWGPPRPPADMLAPSAEVPKAESSGGPAPRAIAPDGAINGRLHASLQCEGLLPVSEVTVTGTRGTLQCQGFIVPFFGHVIHTSVDPEDPQEGAARPWGDGRARRRNSVDRVYGSGESTYYYQLERFVDDLQTLRSGSNPARAQAVMQQDADDSIANMRFVDAAYAAAGLKPRQPSALASAGASTSTKAS